MMGALQTLSNRKQLKHTRLFYTNKLYKDSPQDGFRNTQAAVKHNCQTILPCVYCRIALVCTEQD